MKYKFLVFFFFVSLLPNIYAAEGKNIVTETNVKSIRMEIINETLDKINKHVINAKKYSILASTSKKISKSEGKTTKYPAQKKPALNINRTSQKSVWSKLGLNQKNAGFHGYIENRNYFDIKKNDDQENHYELRNNLRLYKHLRFMPNLHAKISLDASLFFFRSNDQGFRQEEKRVEAWDNYIDWALGNFDLRLGKQIIRWGKSDEVNPTDVFTPEDLSEFFNRIQRAKRKIPVWAAKLNYYFGNYSLESIWLPVFEKTRIDETGGDWVPFIYRRYRNIGLRFLDDDGPDTKFKNSSAAIKLTHQGTDADMSISYSYHFSQTPALEINPLLATVNPEFRRQHTIGGDFETVFGKIGIRGEAAYTTDNFFVSYAPQETDATVYRDTLNYVIGSDYTFENNLYLNLQYAQQYIHNYPGSITTQEIENSILWRITKDFLRDKLRFKTTGRYYLSNKDSVVEFSTRYKITDDLHFTVGFYLFYGEPDNNLFGQYTENDQIYTILKYAF